MSVDSIRTLASMDVAVLLEEAGVDDADVLANKVVTHLSKKNFLAQKSEAVAISDSCEVKFGVTSPTHLLPVGRLVPLNETGDLSG